ncbi:MAG: DNA repair protein RecO [Clostridiales bacterium]|jgi:recombinational DNA repair protein (RecF pathway)|nr:DNA repair protein RecO [Clostridiales bacterium]
MSIKKVRGLVIRESEHGETNKRLTFFAKEYGKITITAIGARKPKSKFLASAQLFTYSDLVLYDGGNYLTVSQSDVIDNFYAIRRDFDSLVLACYFCKLADKTVPYGTQADDILHLLLLTLSALCKGNGTPPELIAAAFETKFLQLHGFTPELNVCACGEILRGQTRTPSNDPVADTPLNGEAPRIWFGEEGVACDNCRAANSTRVTLAVLNAMEYEFGANLSAVFKLRADESTIKMWRGANKLLMRRHLDLDI